MLVVLLQSFFRGLPSIVQVRVFLLDRLIFHQPMAYLVI
jgi:hypothetical protein